MENMVFSLYNISLLLTLVVSCVHIFSSAFVSELSYLLHGAESFLRSQQVLR